MGGIRRRGLAAAIRGLAAALLAVSLLAASGSVSDAQPAQGPSAPSVPSAPEGASTESQSGAEVSDGVLSVLVMGDSYSAGNGAGDYYGPRGCRRSAFNYGRAFQRLVEAAPFNQPAFVETVACSGAVTADIPFSQGDRDPQIDAVNAGYDIVFLTLGGNDVKFAKIIKECLLYGTRAARDCQPLLTAAEGMLADGTIESRLETSLRLIRTQMDSRARLVLLGYPYLEGDPNFRLRLGRSNNYVEVGRRVRGLTDQANLVQRRLVDRLNSEQDDDPFVFVPTSELFRGHELEADGANALRWMIEPYIDADPLSRDIWYHPNRTGHRKEAQLLLRTSAVPTDDVHAIDYPSAGLLAGDLDNFGYGGSGDIPNDFYDLAGAGDLGIFDREPDDFDENDIWTHDFRSRLPNGFRARSVTIEIREVFSDSLSSSIFVDGRESSFVTGSPAIVTPQLRTFTFTGAAAGLANDGIIDISLHENGDNIALDYSRVSVIGTNGSVIS